MNTIWEKLVFRTRKYCG